MYWILFVYKSGSRMVLKSGSVHPGSVRFHMKLVKLILENSKKFWKNIQNLNNIFFKLLKETLPRIRKSAKDQVKASEMSLQMEVNGVLWGLITNYWNCFNYENVAAIESRKGKVNEYLFYWAFIWGVICFTHNAPLGMKTFLLQVNVIVKRICVCKHS